jgi:ribosome maturation factor RimP
VPTFFSAIDRQNEDELSDLQSRIETKLADAEPGVELLAVEPVGRDALRLYIDSPDGVDLALCERVTSHLRDLLAEYSLEVSSPGAERPLTKPEHFRRYLGSQVRVRTREPLDGRRSFTGRLLRADEGSVHLDAGDGELEIPLERIGRSNLVPEEIQQ